MLCIQYRNTIYTGILRHTGGNLETVWNRLIEFLYLLDHPDNPHIPAFFKDAGAVILPFAF